MKVVLLGADGQLGFDLSYELKDYELITLNHKDIEITDSSSIFNVLNKYNPNIVINTTAYNKVDKAEEDIISAFKVNSIGVKYLVDYCNYNNSILVHFSTNYVFDGNAKKPYNESSPTNPINVYGMSKLIGELFVLHYAKKFYLIRTSGLYGKKGSKNKGYNFVNKILELAQYNSDIKVVHDQILTPTSTKNLAKQVIKLLETEQYGLYHITDKGECSWYEFACEIFKIKNLNVNIIPVNSDTYQTKAKRPKYAVLENYNLNKLNINIMSHWKEALRDYLNL